MGTLVLKASGGGWERLEGRPLILYANTHYGWRESYQRIIYDAMAHHPEYDKTDYLGYDR